MVWNVVNALALLNLKTSLSSLPSATRTRSYLIEPGPKTDDAAFSSASASRLTFVTKCQKISKALGALSPSNIRRTHFITSILRASALLTYCPTGGVQRGRSPLGGPPGADEGVSQILFLGAWEGGNIGIRKMSTKRDGLCMRGGRKALGLARKEVKRIKKKLQSCAVSWSTGNRWPMGPLLFA